MLAADLVDPCLNGRVKPYVSVEFLGGVSEEMTVRANYLFHVLEWHMRNGHASLAFSESVAKKSGGGDQCAKHFNESTFGLVATASYIFVHGFNSRPTNPNRGDEYKNNPHMMGFIQWFFDNMNQHDLVEMPSPERMPNMYAWFNNQKAKAKKGCYSDSKHPDNGKYYCRSHQQARGFFIGAAISIGLLLPEVLMAIEKHATKFMSKEEKCLLTDMAGKENNDTGALAWLYQYGEVRPAHQDIHEI